MILALQHSSLARGTTWSPRQPPPRPTRRGARRRLPVTIFSIRFTLCRIQKYEFLLVPPFLAKLFIFQNTILTFQNNISDWIFQGFLISSSCQTRRARWASLIHKSERSDHFVVIKCFKKFKNFKTLLNFTIWAT